MPDSNQHSDLIERVRIYLTWVPPDHAAAATRAIDRLEEQYQALHAAASKLVEPRTYIMKPGETPWVMEPNALDELKAVLRGSNPAMKPLDPAIQDHVEGCICPRFKDIAPDLIADLTCPVHGVEGTDPGDKLGGSYQDTKP